jgi:hypothetical protein
MAAKPSKAGAFALAMGRTTLGEGQPDVVVTERVGRITFAVKGVEYATLELAGDEVVVAIRPTAKDIEQVKRNKAFTSTGDWFTTRCTRNAKSWLASDVGALAGRAIFALRNG